MYAGLRRGELRALEVADIDLAANVIRVQRSWDAVEGLIEPKSHAGHRSVPIPRVLRSVLIEPPPSRARPRALACGGRGEEPFQPKTLSNRAGRAWKRVGLQ